MTMRLVMVCSAVIVNLLGIGSTLWMNLSVTWVTGILILNIVFFLAMHIALRKLLNDLSQLVEGGDGTKKVTDHIRGQLMKVGEFAKESRQVLSRINELGDGQFANVISQVKSTDIRTALTQANNKILALRKQEQEQNWVTQGVASVADVKQKDNDVIAYCTHVLKMVINYLGANQGALFLAKVEHENEPFFEMAAAYAYGEQKHVEKRIQAGVGIVGQSLYEKEMVYLTDVPKDYIKITSGLGETTPQSICIVPLVFDGNVQGVLEIASFHLMQPYQQEYLKNISESIGYNLASIENHRKTEDLLVDSQKMAEEVKSQEEELRQNMEELRSTQEQMQKKEYEMSAVLASLSTVALDQHGHIADANDIFLSITGYERDAILGKSYKSLIPKAANDMMQYDMMFSSILEGRTFSGEFRMLNEKGKEVWMTGNFTPINNESGQLCKIMVVSLFTTQDKEKLLDLQELVNALKSCFPMAEINPDVSFKTANDLFLSELGIRRLDLKKSSPKAVLEAESFKKVEQYILDVQEQPDNMVLDIQTKNGSLRKFNSTLVKMKHNGENQKKGLLILRNPV